MRSAPVNGIKLVELFQCLEDESLLGTGQIRKPNEGSEFQFAKWLTDSDGQKERKESKPDHIMNAETLECENHCSQAAPLNLRDCIFGHALLPELRRVNSETFSGRSSSSSAGSLTGLTSVDRTPI